jgi:hypothetical protein
MAYSFNGTNQYLRTPDNDPPFPNLPMTISAHIYDLGAAVDRRRIVSFARNSTVNGVTIGAAFNSFRLEAAINDDTNVSGAATTLASVSYSANSWNTMGATFDSTLRKAFLNFTATATNTATLGAITGVVRFAIGAVWRNIITQYFDGYVAEVAVWNVNLTDDEMKSLWRGFKPHRVRPQSLVYYSPLVRDLQDVRQNRTITNINSATVTDHPRVY